MISTIKTLFEEYIERVGVIPDVVYMNRAHYQQLNEECPGLSDDPHFYFGFDVIISPHFDTPKVGLLKQVA